MINNPTRSIFFHLWNLDLQAMSHVSPSGSILFMLGLPFLFILVPHILHISVYHCGVVRMPHIIVNELMSVSSFDDYIDSSIWFPI